MIPNDTPIWIIVFTIMHNAMGYPLYIIKRVISTTFGEMQNMPVICDYTEREQLMVFFRPDKAPWDKEDGK